MPTLHPILFTDLNREIWLAPLLVLQGWRKKQRGAHPWVLVLCVGLLAVGTLAGCEDNPTPLPPSPPPTPTLCTGDGGPFPWLPPMPWPPTLTPPDETPEPPTPPPGAPPDIGPHPPDNSPDLGGGGGGKTAYLTFDDGPEGLGYTSSIATKLSNEGIEATFFLIGELEDGTHLLPALASHVVTIRDGGHAIGIHGWTHRAWNSDIDYLTEIQTMHDALLDALGSLDDKLLRAPYGAFAPPPYSGYEGWYYYGWTMPQGDPKDSFSDSAADVVRKVKEHLGENPPDNIVMLLHSNRPGTYEAIVNDQNDESIDLIKVFKDLGYTRFKKLPRPDDPTDIVIWP